MGPGATLAKYAAMGHRVAFVTATEGGAGRLFEARPMDEVGRERLKSIRRVETARAAEILGIEFLGFWGWEDGGLARRSVLEVEEKIAALLRRERPDVVISFHGSGISYHADHRIMTMASMAAFLGSGRKDWYRDGEPAGLPPHSPSKFYAYVPNAEMPYWEGWPRDIYRADSKEITTFIDTRETAAMKWQAIQAHDSQKNGPPFQLLYDAGAFEHEFFVRLLPSPRPGERETDLLEGLEE
jgi:mycothiol S-conjugate amidase